MYCVHRERDAILSTLQYQSVLITSVLYTQFPITWKLILFNMYLCYRSWEVSLLDDLCCIRIKEISIVTGVFLYSYNESQRDALFLKFICMFIWSRRPWKIHSRYLTFRGTCIVIYSYNESQWDALFYQIHLTKYSACFGQVHYPKHVEYFVK